MMKKHSSGFTLVEILVAVIVLALGLLGLAGMEARSLANNQSAYSRSMATQLAYDIADRMRANNGVAANYVSTFMKPSAATCSSVSNKQCNACNSSINACNPAQMAVRDLWEWNASLQSLPSGTGQITVNGGVYTVTVTWDDSKGQQPLVNFSMSFRL